MFKLNLQQYYYGLAATGDADQGRLLRPPAIAPVGSIFYHQTPGTIGYSSGPETTTAPVADNSRKKRKN
jgi:DNA helicase IV